MKKIKSLYVKEDEISVITNRQFVDNKRIEIVTIKHLPTKLEATATSDVSQIEAYNNALLALEEKAKNPILINMIADLVFAYKNKDEDCPHDFEIKAVNNAIELLEIEYKGEIYTKKFFEECKMKNWY